MDQEDWDPRKTDFNDPNYSIPHKDGPAYNFTRTTNLASNKENVREATGCYVAKFGENMTEQKLTNLFSQYGKVLSARIIRKDYGAFAIVKTHTAKEALNMIQSLNGKAPLYLRVNHLLSEEEKKTRKVAVDMEKSMCLDTAASLNKDNQLSKPVEKVDLPPPRVSAGRGKIYSNIVQNEAVKIVNQQSIRNSEEVKCDKSENTLHMVGSGPVLSSWSKPKPCISCKIPGKVRCSVCKAWYCSQMCQQDDWYYHKTDCCPPPCVEYIDERTGRIVLSATSPDSSSNSSIKSEKISTSIEKIINFDETEEQTLHSECNQQLKRLYVNSCSNYSSALPNSTLSDSKSAAVSVSSSAPNFIETETGKSISDNKEIHMNQLESRSPVYINVPQLCSPSACTELCKKDIHDFPESCKNRLKSSPKDLQLSLRKPYSLDYKSPLQSESVSPFPTTYLNSLLGEVPSSLDSEALNSTNIPTESQTNNRNPSFMGYLEQTELNNIFAVDEICNAAITYGNINELCIVFPSNSLKEILMFCENFNSTNLQFSASVGMKVMAYSEMYQSWFRAFITEITESNKFRVLFLDYGNTETVEKISTYPVNSKMSALLPEVFYAKLHKIMSRVDIKPDDNIKVKPLNIRPNAMKALLVLDNTEVGTYIIKPWNALLLNKNNTTEGSEYVERKTYTKDSLKYIQLLTGEKYQVTFAWVLEDNIVCVQLSYESFVKELKEMQNIIDQHCLEKKDNSHKFNVGDVVCAFCTISVTWNRAIILEVKKEGGVVEFLDYGNVSNVLFSNLRPFSDKLLDFKVQALKIKFRGVSRECKITNEKLKQMMQCCEELTIKPITVEPIIDCIIYDKSGAELNEKLSFNPAKEDRCTSPLYIQPKVVDYSECKSLSLPVSDNVPVNIIYTSGPHNIYVIPTNEKEVICQFPKLQEKMNSYCNSQKTVYYKPQLHEVCLAKYSEDENWYRATCIEYRNRGALVFFIDYGNFEVVEFNSMCQMIQAFLEIPAMVVHCRLNDVADDMVDEKLNKRVSQILHQGLSLNIIVLRKNEDTTYSVKIKALLDILIKEGLVKS